MNLIPVQVAEFTVGQPLPWAVFDAAQQQILAHGYVLKTEDELKSLTNVPLFRADATSAETAESEAAPDPANSAGFVFDDMRLKVGDRLQLEAQSSVSTERCMVSLIGYIEGKVLLVTTPVINDLCMPLINGDRVLLRVFSGRTAFAFSAYVDATIKQPFNYLHLTFPRDIAGKIIRKSHRIKVDIPVKVANGDQASVDGTISNLSATGTEIRMAAAPGNLGEMIKLSFVLSIYGVETRLQLTGAIRSLRQDARVDRGSMTCGAEFHEPGSQNTASLQSFIYHQMFERPDKIT